jgi:hypothetical protein
MTESTDEVLAGFALRRVVERYAFAVDRGDGALFAAQFTEDGVLDAPRGRFVGREALRGVPAMVQGRYDRTFHAVLNFLPTVSGDRAEAETYAIARHFFRDAAGQSLCYEMTIRYQDRFRKSEAGWLLSSRTLVLDATRTFPVDALDP